MNNKFYAIPACILFFYFVYSFLDKPLALILKTLYPEESIFWTKITFLGSFEFLYFGVAFILIIFFLLRYILRSKLIAPALILLLIYSVLSSVLAVQLLKSIFHRYRPNFIESNYGFVFQSSTIENLDSFPSLHTSCFAALAMPFVLRYRNIYLRIVSSLGIFLVSASRLILHTHYLSDVLFSIYLVWCINILLFRSMQRDLYTTDRLPA